ncbi:unnamed protein product [Cuscuta campestris]|uniref:Uncharacterized protein n=1 Tax=Cuscuta campestris TaxID=132261 RepID=A0A484LLH3_9ASTE|nr:unnamed protein product [Cuscuta campestris]
MGSLYVDHSWRTLLGLYGFEQTNRELHKKNPYLQFVGQDGYEMLQRELAASQATSSADIAGSSTKTGTQLGRENFWLRGHAPGRKPKVTDPALMEICDRIVQLKGEVAEANDGLDPLVAMVNQEWYHNNYLTINYILEGLAETLYPVYAGVKLAKELWSTLNKKYQAEDVGTKKFIVEKMLDYKMVDSKSVVA